MDGIVMILPGYGATGADGVTGQQTIRVKVIIDKENGSRGQTGLIRATVRIQAIMKADGVIITGAEHGEIQIYILINIIVIINFMK